MTPLLDVQDLHVTFDSEDGLVRAVDGVSFSVEPGKTLGIVGESGSGKSVTSLTVMGLTRGPLDQDLGHGDRSRATDLIAASDDELRGVRGNDVAMIFQDPLSSLHPFYKVGTQLVEAIQTHQHVSRGGGAATAPASCSSWSASPSRASACRTTRTSSPAACASAR